MLKRTAILYRIENGVKIDGKNESITGDCSGLTGDCTGLTGDLDGCGVTEDQRNSGVDIRTLVE